MPCAYVPFDARAAMFWGSWHDRRGHVLESRAAYRATNHVHSGHTTHISTPTLSPLYITNSSSRLSQAHKPEHHGLRRHDYVDPDVEPEKLKTVNNALVSLRFSCVYGSAKRHTICVATRVVFLVVFEGDHDLPSNTRQRKLYLEADSNATALLKSKDRDFPRQMAKTRLGRPALSTGQTKLTMCFGGILELMLEMWPFCAQHRWHQRCMMKHRSPKAGSRDNPTKFSTSATR